MPEAEAELLRQHYEDADVILEYGSGGSTVMASEMEGKHITSVESDKAWWKMMMEWFETNPASKGSTVDMLYADIGPTREWMHATENFLGQPEITGRMATFKLEPQPFPTGRMLEIIDYMLRP